ncbi:MAG: hypothetical protein ABIH08_02410 [Candidatus Omnitrophota bacterium]
MKFTARLTTLFITIGISFFDLERVRVADTAGIKVGEQDSMTRCWEDVLIGQTSAAFDVRVSEYLKVPTAYFASAVYNKEDRMAGIVVARITISRLYEMVKGGAKIQEEDIDIINKDGILIYPNHNPKGILKDNLSNWKVVEKVSRGDIIGSGKCRHTGGEEAIYVFCR